MITAAVLEARMARFSDFIAIHQRTGLTAFISAFACSASDEEFDSVMSDATEIASTQFAKEVCK